MAMGAPMFGSILEYGKTAAATLGVGSALLAAYTSMGLPLPASQAETRPGPPL